MGRHNTGGFEVRYLDISAPITLIYGEAKGDYSMPYLGAYRRAPPCDSGLPKPFLLDEPGPNPIGKDAYFSWASLVEISSTLAFYDPYTGSCRGVVFQYRNGGSRAVGECRIHVHPAKRVDGPVRLCFQVEQHSSQSQVLRRVRVEFKHNPQREPSDEEWECRPLIGVMKFWVTNEESFLAVEAS